MLWEREKGFIEAATIMSIASGSVIPLNWKDFCRYSYLTGKNSTIGFVEEKNAASNVALQSVQDLYEY